MNTIDLLKKYRHIFETDYTADANCVLAYLMNVDEDPLTDSSGEGNTGALAGAGTPNFRTLVSIGTGGTGAKAAKYDGCYRFVTNSIINCGAGPSLDGLIDFSLVAWAYTANSGYLISQRNEGYDGQYVLEIAAGKLSFYVYGDGAYQFVGEKIVSTTSLTDSAWHHAGAYRKSGGGGGIYVDGVEEDTDTGTTKNLDNTITVHIGEDGRTGGKLLTNGCIDEPAIFDRELDSTEFNAIMDSGLDGTAPVVTDNTGEFVIDTDVDQNYGAVAVDGDGNVWGVFPTGLKKSTDGGETFVEKDTVAVNGPAPPTGKASGKSVFVAANGYIYWSQWGTGKIRRSVNGGEDWADVCTLDQDENSGIWGFCEDSLGYLYAAVYTKSPIDNAEIWRSVNNGADWSSCYSSALRHMHDVACDPVTDYIYATTGDDGAEDENTLIRSVDHGANWTTVNSAIDGLCTNFLSGIRLIGDDDIGHIFRTTDDSDYYSAYQPALGLSNFATSKYDGRVYFGSVTHGGAGIGQLISTVNGRDYRIDWVNTGHNSAWDGIHHLSNPGSDGYIYASVQGGSNFKFFVGAPGNPYPIDWLKKKVISGYHCFMGGYMDAKRKSYDPLKLPNGTIF